LPKSFKFTDASISSLEPEAGKRDIMRFDTVLKGFGVRVGRSGAKTFILQTRTHTGRAWRTPLGRYPALNVPQARTKAKKLIGELAGGRDPFAEREQKRNRPPAYTVRMAIEDWRTYRAAYGSSSYATKAARTLLAALADRLDQPAVALSRSEIGALWSSWQGARAEKGSTGGRSQRRLVATRLRAVYRHAITTGRLDPGDDPTLALKLPPRGKSRDRFLDSGELRRVWQAAGSLPPPAGAYVQFLMTTVVRVREAAGAEWGEIDAKRALWTIPETRMKGTAPHIVPLSDAARQILATVGPTHMRWVFTRRDGRNCLTSVDRVKAALDRALALDGGPSMQPWVLHDLRRSFATWAARSDLNPIVADKCLAHAPAQLTDTARVYQVHDFLEQRGVILQRYGEFLTASENAEVVPLPGAERARA
jgi:integrase